jgi:hypothetical protein
MRHLLSTNVKPLLGFLLLGSLRAAYPCYVIEAIKSYAFLITAL